LVLALAAAGCSGRADSVVVFNELMYHPPANESQLEWVELHNQLAVDVDLSGWSITGGIGFLFPEGVMIKGGGYLVVAASPVDLQAATGATNVVGPFTGRLANSGDTLRLRNNNQRLMDSIAYEVEGDWPVGPDGSGGSLAKRDEETASSPARSWTVSALVGGTPGRRNFPVAPFEVAVTNAQWLNGTWSYEASGADPGAAWASADFDDHTWPSGPGLFQVGSVSPPGGEPEPVPTVFSTGMGLDGTVLAPGLADPHYQLTQSAQTKPPPPAIPATVIQNHPVWLANDTGSAWIGALNPGAADVAAGSYDFRTTFALDGFDPTKAVLTMNLAVDNELTNVVLNGVPLGSSYAGFTAWSGPLTINKGFRATNTLDFLTLNAGTSPNPAGFRARLSAQAPRLFPVQTRLPTARTNLYFRSRFRLDTPPRHVALKLSAIVADGAVFYLNGHEVLRLNLPAGPVTASTSALTNVPAPAYLGPVLLPTANLVVGTNVLAVEVHSATNDPGDILFGAALAVTATNVLVPPPVTLAFNEIASATNASFWLELVNHGASPLDLGGCVLARHGDTTNREFTLPARTLAPGQMLALDKATLGFSADPGDRLFLFSPERDRVLDAVVAKRRARGRWPDGAGAWWYPAAPTPGASNDFKWRDELVINEIMHHAPDIPPVAAAYGTNTFIGLTNTWKYHGLGQDLGTAWRAMAYDDSGWLQGQAVFYNTSAVLPAPKNTLLSLTNSAGARIVTWYFRTPFSYQGESSNALFTLRPLVDDGAVYYLNGREIYRQNMPTSEVFYPTLASPGVATPAFSGPFTVAVSNLVSGVNLLAVEVHQFTLNPIAADMAFGLEASMIGLVQPAVPGQASPEAWVELYNRSGNPVDLAGWQLAHDLNYRFPPGTRIASGGYLVVAGDVAYMQSNYPALAVVGPFAGKLRHNNCHLLLLDPAGNPADELRYYNGKPWPEYADGGGSSLELRDPWADNAKPESWADSREGAQSAWNNYTYRATAANLLGPTRWNEFVMGLLDVGECLVDDLSVLEDPDGTRVQLLQNGDFERGLAAWRALGDHDRSRVEVDPDNPGNHVLHLIATGPTEHMHNHLETTYAGGRTLTDGRQYLVSFRAKWLAGNHRLNTRLYFNRVARTTELASPLHHGTPGARNSTFTGNAGPTFAALSHDPIVPPPAAPVTVTASAADPQGMGAVALFWSANGGAWNRTPMWVHSPAFELGYTNYVAVLPGQSAGTLVQMYVQATDRLGAVATCPAGGTNSRALFRVDEGKALMPKLHRLRLLMTPADAEFLHASTNVMSMDRLGLTLVADDRDVFYDVGVHLQSSERGRDSSYRVGYTIRFNADRLFRGVQPNITLDRSGGYSGLGGRHDELLLWHAVNHAGGLLGLDCDLVQVFAPRPTEDSTALLRMAAFNGDYFDNQFNRGAEGNRYKLELIYYPLTTVNGDPQAPKLPQPDDVVNVEIQDRGNDQENYRWTFIQENHADADDYRQVIALNQAFSLTGPTLESRINALLDTDEYLRTLAFKAFTGDVDTYTAGLGHNWKFYFRPDDGRALGLLWDMDFSFVQAINAGFPGGGSPNTYKIVTLPNNYRRYCNHLLDLMTTTVNTAHLRPWAARYAGLIGEDWSGVVNYLQQRADFIRSQLPLSTPFAITSNGGRDFSTTNDHVALTGTAPLTVKTIQVNGLGYPLAWTSLTVWTLTVPLPARTNLLVLQGLDNYGNRLSNALDSITITNRGAPALRPVIINEWMADNTGPGGWLDPVANRYSDWLELFNPNNVPVPLAGYCLTDDLREPAKWSIPANTVIPALGFLLVWADGRTNLNGQSVTGDLHTAFQLNNSGEAIGLYAPDGAPQHLLQFGLQQPNISQGLFPDGNTNAFYFMTNWTPRAANTLAPLPAPALGHITVQPDGQVSLTFSTLPARTYRIDYADDLATAKWIPLSTNRADVGALLTAAVATGGPQRFFRVCLLP
jgi:hypothetical protein